MSEQLSSNSEAELLRRNRAAVLTVRVFLALTVALSVAAFLGRDHFRHRDNPLLDIAVRLAIFFFGVGSVVLRRTRFSAMRLQDIAALRGISGLLATLERTTLEVAGLGVTIAIFGFSATLMTGNDFYAYGAGLVGMVVLLWCYPTRTSWERAVAKFGVTANGPPPPPIF